MMKKNGFTLAEVLITLAIIGVVATMTLPALMTNTGEQQAKTALKKAVNTLTEAVNMHDAISNVNFDTMIMTKTAPNADTDDSEAASLVSLLRARTAIDYAATGDGGTLPNPKQTGAVGAPEGVSTVVHLRDGSSILYNNAGSFNTAVAKDNLTQGLVVVVDTNGKKGPNLLSNCTGAKVGADETQKSLTTEWDGSTASATDLENCNDKSQRVINDRFLVRLRGNIAQPEGAAATWAFNN